MSLNNNRVISILPHETDGLPRHEVNKPRKTFGTYPLTRLKSSYTVTSSGKLFLFGGFDEDDVLDGNVYLYDIQNEIWECVTSKELIAKCPSGSGKVFREGHSVLSVLGEENVIVFGGVPPNDTDNSSNNLQLRNQNVSDLLVFDLKSKRWQNLTLFQPKRCLPLSRSRHAACLSPDGKTMFISGGLDTTNYSVTFDDLYSFDLVSHEWNGPWKFIPRFDHHITVHKGKIWSFGGLSNDMAHVNEVSWFDLQNGSTGCVRIDGIPRLNAESGGDHIFINPTQSTDLDKETGVVLDVVVPLVSNLDLEHVASQVHQPFIGIYDIDRLRNWKAFNLPVGPGALGGFSWRLSFCFAGRVHFIGYQLTQGDQILEPGELEERRMDSIASLELADLGVTTGTTNINASGSLLMVMKGLLYSGEYTDFQIIGLDSEERPQSIDPMFLEHDQDEEESPGSKSTSEVFHKSIPIPTHKLILQARWPYVRTLVSSGMSESQTNVLFLQEPFIWLKALLEYIYTDDLPQDTKSNIDMLSGLLLISNLYDLPRLRPLVLREINTIGFHYSTVAQLWSRARLVNEVLLCYHAKVYIFSNWGKVVKSESFARLSREELLELMSEVNSEAMIISSSTVSADQIPMDVTSRASCSAGVFCQFHNSSNENPTIHLDSGLNSIPESPKTSDPLDDNPLAITSTRRDPLVYSVSPAWSPLNRHQQQINMLNGHHPHLHALQAPEFFYDQQSQRYLPYDSEANLIPDP